MYILDSLINRNIIVEQNAPGSYGIDLNNDKKISPDEHIYLKSNTCEREQEQDILDQLCAMPIPRTIAEEIIAILKNAPATEGKSISGLATKYIPCFSEKIALSSKQKEVPLRTYVLPDQVNIVRGPSGKKTFYITFDLNSEPETYEGNKYVDQCMAILKKYGCKAIFFLTYEFIRDYPEETKRLADSGFTIGNHGKHIKFKNKEQVLTALRETEELYKKVTGKEMTKLWRTPYLQHYGKKNSWMLEVAHEHGYRHIDASLCTVDWVDTNDPRYLANDEFMELFREHLDFSRTERMHINKLNKKGYTSRTANYDGVIILLHPMNYRKKGADFALCLEPMIKHLFEQGYQFSDFSIDD